MKLVCENSWHKAPALQPKDMNMTAHRWIRVMRAIELDRYSLRSQASFQAACPEETMQLVPGMAKRDPRVSPYASTIQPVKHNLKYDKKKESKQMYES